MRIAIDAQELSGKATGVGRYVSQLLRAWSTMPSAREHEFILCAPEDVHPVPADGLRLSRLTSPGRGSLWQQTALPRLVATANADVLFAPAYSGPVLSRTPTVVSIHDVSYFARPEWFGWREGLRRRLLTRLSARRARRVLTFSEFSKGEIARYVGVAPGLIDVTYHGVTTLETRAGETAATDEVNRDPLVLFVGSIFNRRHLPAVIAGFERLTSHLPARLAIVGENRTRPHVDLSALIAASPAAGRVRLHSWLPDADLAVLYRRATAFVFLSDYEGFGMTPLEAIAAGVPPVVLDTPITREIYGGAAHYIDRPDAQLVAGALERVIIDAAERRRLLDAAAGVLARYSWHDCAQRTLNALLNASLGH
jgi:glycosyltransferase involved in cell wall biosynthesis